MHTLARRACDWRCFGLIGLALAVHLALASAADDGCEKFAWSLRESGHGLRFLTRSSVAAGERILTAVSEGSLHHEAPTGEPSIIRVAA